MQNLEAYQKLESEKQLAKIQITTAFLNYLKSTFSICMSQQSILQNAGINPSHFFGVGPNGRPNILQASYFDPATIFGPTLALFNSLVPQAGANGANPIQNTMIQNNQIPQNNSHSSLSIGNSNSQFSCQSPSMNLQASNPFQNRIADSFPKVDSYDKDGLLDEFFDQRISGTSTKYSFSTRDDNEIDTGKKITLDRESEMEESGVKKTKVTCGHPWKPHHAKGLCKNCYETHGKTRKPWKCDHQAHFAKGYCKKCYLRIRQQNIAKDAREAKESNSIAKESIAMEENNMKADNSQVTKNEMLATADSSANVKEETF